MCYTSTCWEILRGSESGCPQDEAGGQGIRREGGVEAGEPGVSALADYGDVGLCVAGLTGF